MSHVYIHLFLQCRDGVGVCPDKESSAGGTCREDNFDISGSVKDGVTCVTYSRHFDTGGLHNEQKVL